MKIAFVAQPFDVVSPTSSSSLAIWVHELSKRVAKHHDVTVLSRQDPHLDNLTVEDGVKHIRITTAIDDMLKNVVKALDSVVGKALGENKALFYRYFYFEWYYYFFYILTAAWYTRRLKADVVIVLNFSQFLPVIRFVNRDTCVSIVMQCDWLIELDERRVNRRLENACAVFGCSDYIANGISQRFPRYQDRCYTLYNGSNPTIFSDTVATREMAAVKRRKLGLKDEKVILFVGRVTPEKGVHVLVESMRRVLETRSDCVLLIVGGIYPNPPSPKYFNNNHAEVAHFEALKQDYESYLRKLAKGLGEKVTLVGAVPHHELSAYYSLSDIFVHPAIWNEPFGMIITEAMSCERAVVSSRVGGIPEIIVEGETGLLVPPNDPQALADAILRLLNDDIWRLQMGKKGRERVGRAFSWEESSRTLMEIVSDLVRKDLPTRQG